MAKNRDDNGCPRAKELGYFGPCLLVCPFPNCIEDDPDFTPTRFKREWRNEEIRRQWKQGESIEYLAVKFGISVRTVLRVVE